MKKIILSMVMALGISFAFTACNSVSPVSRADKDVLSRETSIVFVRPSSYWWLFGTTSMRDYVEIMYEKSSVNNAGFLQVQVGLRNKGGQHLWDVSGPDFFTINGQTKFFSQPLVSGGQMSPPVYETNSQQITLDRGAVREYKVICPDKSAKYYQVILSDALSN
ncbi:MAG: hypothetical protein NT118_02445 [Lentisphaerae bacterium]|nr:hypothetical protein [Lentisphaerota bacterium]